MSKVLTPITLNGMCGSSHVFAITMTGDLELLGNLFLPYTATAYPPNSQIYAHTWKAAYLLLSAVSHNSSCAVSVLYSWIIGIHINQDVSPL